MSSPDLRLPKPDIACHHQDGSPPAWALYPLAQSNRRPSILLLCECVSLLLLPAHGDKKSHGRHVKFFCPCHKVTQIYSDPFLSMVCQGLIWMNVRHVNVSSICKCAGMQNHYEAFHAPRYRQLYSHATNSMKKTINKVNAI